jgi:hypothetical protein
MATTDPGFWQGIMETATGRGQLRLIIQPTIAIIVGLRMGISDAKLGKDPFLMRLALTSSDRSGVLKEAAGKLLVPFCLAIVFDGILQYLTLGYVRPLAALIMGALLIFVPFTVSRSFTNRIYRRRQPQPA